MAPLSIQSGVEYAKTLLPETLLRSVSSVQATVTRHILPPAQPRCFKVCTQSRRRCRSLVASSLDELLEQAARVLLLSCRVFTLVLEEDGTVIDSEAFFQTLPGDTALMVLEKGEMWTRNKMFPSFRQPKRNGIAKLTFDLYKLHPQEFLGCLSVRATLYDIYTLSYDFRCTKAKHVLRLLLRCCTYMTRLAGQLLLHASASIPQLSAEDDC
ncbi:cell death activator CIDE-A [Myripristis murdjan]|uniref:Cell death inducing DFFA like effector a n=1 Tax=Myripristis murdjan TaxID=586833 RepID=A0A667ZFS6_9TELE|nr:cell death activator CIDE-A-like [Myripristis murdjan]XP_029935581.1 cell death activator CIDE-A-like [Myripristis murdjan]XP_029935582.1 cell death activator CIDE-A-like [Myripristis murdjan]